MAQGTCQPHAAVVAGTRPEIVKVARLVRLLGDQTRLLHTREHASDELSGVVVAAAKLPTPQELTGICGAPRYAQIGRMIEQLGTAFSAIRPAVVVVQGDTDTASAAAQAANYVGVPVVVVEAGLQSSDRRWPEESSRWPGGVLADLYCAPTQGAEARLLADGVPASKIELTGSTIVEATRQMLPDEPSAAAIAASYGVDPHQYVLSTIRRPENTDDAGHLEAVLTELSKLGLPVIMPVHPRTRLAAERYRVTAALDRLLAVPPVDYRTFLALARLARLIVSDCAGVQEECTVLKRPLLVIRDSAERPESIEAGFAHLVRPGPRIGKLGRELIADYRLSTRLAEAPCPFGDGLASDRIAASVRRFLA
jgi:UDP-N-acetylglucosamine 2-epimerase (non-hydrolysing)